MTFDHPRGAPTLATDRLRLRPLTAADTEAVLAVFSDLVVTRYLDRLPMTTLADAVAGIERAAQEFEDGRALRLGIVFPDDDRVIGTVSLLHIDWASRRAEVGYGLAQAYWHRGLAAEAVTAILDYGFNTLGFHRIEAELDPRNQASADLLLRHGFVREGLLRDRCIVGDEISDSLIMGLLQREWRDRRPA